MMEARGLSKSFGKVQAVREVSFLARDGRITGLLGPNGAGKSTTLRMLCTVLHPDSGEALIDGHVVEREPIAARRLIGELSHASGLYPHLTGAENIAYFGELHGLSRAESRRRADELVTGLTWPIRRGQTGYAFEELAQRHGDFAIAAVAVEATVAGDGTIADVSVGLGGVEDRPFVAATAGFVGKPATEATASDIANTIAEVVDPMVDLQANADYRRQLVRVLGTRTLTAAFDDATGQQEAA